MTKVELTPAYLIHRRAYQDNSLLLDFLTRDHGKIRLVARGMRKSKTKLQMFTHLHISYSGKGELKTLTHWEINDTPRVLLGEDLILGMYVNEVIDRVLPEHDPHEELFLAYQDFITSIAPLSKAQKHWSLRLFENNLLEVLGYGLSFEQDIQGDWISAEASYEYHQQSGFCLSSQGIMPGKLLQRLAKQDMDAVPDSAQLRLCRDLNRERLRLLLGDKPLNSRELYCK